MTRVRGRGHVPLNAILLIVIAWHERRQVQRGVAEPTAVD